MSFLTWRKYDEQKKMVRRKEVPYIVSPWALTWSDENYYMIAYNAMDEKTKHYRVDKLRNVEILPERRIGLDKFIDRFGRKISIHPSDREGWSEIHVEVALSDQFLGWIFAIGSGVKILGPDEVVEAFRKKLKEMAKEYK